MSRLFGALVALFLCLLPAVAQDCRPLDEVLDRIAESGRKHVVIERGAVLDGLRQFYAASPPAGSPPSADRAIVIDFATQMIILFVDGEKACSPLVTDLPQIRALIFGVRL